MGSSSPIFGVKRENNWNYHLVVNCWFIRPGYLPGVCGWDLRLMATRNPGRTHQSRLVVFPIIYRVSYISRGCLGFLPSGCHERFVGWRNRESRAKPLFATATGWWINPIYITWWLKRKNTKQKKNFKLLAFFGGVQQFFGGGISIIKPWVSWRFPPSF